MELSVLGNELISGGATWSHVLKRGTALRITDVDGGANVAAYFLNFEMPSERFNLPDTLKAQHTARLTKGHVLYSDMGRILCSIIEDTVGWHDPLAGISNAALVEKKYGKTTYQQARNDWHQNARDGLVDRTGKVWTGLARSARDGEFLQQSDGGPRRPSEYVAHNSKPGELCGVARGDECAGLAEHMPASARSGHGLRAQAGGA